MYFRRQAQLDDQLVAVSLSGEIKSCPHRFEVDGSLSVDSGDFDAFQLEGLGNWICNPTFTEAETDLTLIGDDSENPIRLSVKNYPSQNQSIEIVFPPLSILKAARICANENPNRIPPQIKRSYQGENRGDKIDGFLREISAVVSYDSYIKIVEQLAKISPKFRHYLRQDAEQQLTRMVVGRWDNEEYSIESYKDLTSRIQDFEKLDPIQKLSKEFDIRQIIKQALKKTAQSGSIDDQVDLVRTLELFKNHADLLRSRQIDATLATQLIDEDFNGAWNLILNCLPSAKRDDDRNYQSVKEQALAAESHEQKREFWKKSLHLASGSKNLRISIANYLYWTGRSEEYDNRLLALLYEGAASGFSGSGIEHMEQNSEYSLHFQLGVNHRSGNNYKEAAAAFFHAYEVSGGQGRQDDQSTWQQTVARRNWAINKSDHHRFEGEYETGIKFLQSVIDEITEETRETTHNDVKETIIELQAQTRILEMEQYLVEGDYELALETAGNIIKQYSKTGNENSQQWAITKRREIQAITHETNGDLDDAASLHRSIGESDSISKARQNWHIHRADICQAKQLALESQFERAKEQLLQIQERTDRLKSEANDLSVVLDAIIDYQNGVHRDFRESLDRLSSNSQLEPREPPMRLEYNYEDPLAVIHAVQWLRTYDVDTEILSMSVDVALQASLIPLHDGIEAAETIGLDDVNLRDQWLMNLPAPIAQRITQIRLDTSVPQTDYSGLGSRLFNLLELYLAIYGEYYGSLQWGEEWRRNLSDANKSANMALGDLANVFTKCGDKIGCSTSVSNLINGAGSEPSVVKLRNDIGHGKTDDVHSDEYEAFQDRVFSIFQNSADETPIIGEMIETRGRGDFQVKLIQLKWWRTQRRVFIQTDAELETGELYYFPQSKIQKTAENSKVAINPDEIIKVKTDRILSKFN